MLLPPRGDEGATIVEYALLTGLIAVLLGSAVTLLGGNVLAVADAVAGYFGAGAEAGR